MTESAVSDNVTSLIRKPFSTLSFAEKKRSIDQGRPKPCINKTQPCKDGFICHFTDASFERIEWLTGSVSNNKLYFWPCLLFIPEKSLWNSTGFGYLSSPTKSSKKYGLSQGRTYAMSQLKTFCRAHFDFLTDNQNQI